MEMKQINESTLKISVSLDDLDSYGMELKDFLMPQEKTEEFFYAISYSCGMNLHIKVLTGGNNHHMAEAMFKSFAKALDAATSYDPRITDVLSTKGSLA